MAESVKIDDLKEDMNEGLIFHDFLGKDIYHFKNLNPIKVDDFSLYQLSAEETSTEETAYRADFEKIHQSIESGAFDKVILSRIKVMPTQKSALEIFERLNEHYQNTFNYIISCPELGTWIGASPETLVSIDQLKIKTMSLAGTKTADDNWTQKEIDEQNFVTEAIITNLEKVNCSEIQANGPNTITAGPIEHLQTKITARLSNESDWVKLVHELHPTPAVCGIPTEASKRLIHQVEKHDRNFYTGYIGLLSKKHKQFFVNLRCMELLKGCAKLYVGGGLTADSKPDLEWLETERKSMTLSNCL